MQYLKEMAIRKFNIEDIDSVLNIWLHTNIHAHHFIPASYWNNNMDLMRTLIPSADVYIYDNGGYIKGFAGVSDAYIAGIFVKEGCQSKGIGKMLIDRIKDSYSELRLSVYAKNFKAVSFYLREGFEEEAENINIETSERDYQMLWRNIASI